MHENFVFDAARGVGGELDVLPGVEGVDGLDESDRADGDQVFDADTGVFKPPRDVYDEPQVVLNQQGGGFCASLGQSLDGGLLLRAVERSGHGVAPADVKHLRRRAQSEPLQQPQQGMMDGTHE